MVNHWEFHKELSTKNMLFINMHNYCQKHRIKLYNIIPLTFFYNMKEEEFERKF